jgi:hypothetical protein
MFHWWGRRGKRESRGGRGEGGKEEEGQATDAGFCLQLLLPGPLPRDSAWGLGLTGHHGRLPVILGLYGVPKKSQEVEVRLA